MRASYVLPLKWQEPESDDVATAELAAYLSTLAGLVEDVLVVDGSAELLYAAHARAWAPYARHLPPDPRWDFANGKVNGVTTGLMAARHEAVVLADDDVRYDAGALERVVRLLADADLVRPQNVFVPATGPLPWHARWDTARSLLNRAWSTDYPGTFGVRRSTFLRMGGYNGEVLFENLELIRTVKAAGGVEVRPLDLYVPRHPPDARRFWDQRRRQAYDDFAQPGRLLVELAILPMAGYGLARRGQCGRRAILGAAACLVAVAELGRRRAGGAAVFPVSAALMAPLWATERGICVWLAVGLRARHGGVQYAGNRLRVAAHSTRKLRRRRRHGSVALRELVPYARAEPDESVRAVAERLEAGRSAAAERDGTPPGVDLRAVGRPQQERAAHDEGSVLVRRDRHRDVRRPAGVAILSALLHARRTAP